MLHPQVAVDKIGAVIGPGGRNIQAARDASGADSINVSPGRRAEPFLQTRTCSTSALLCLQPFRLVHVVPAHPVCNHESVLFCISEDVLLTSGPAVYMQIAQDGWVTVMAYSDEKLEAALKIIRDTVAEIESGEIYRCAAGRQKCVMRGV